MTDDFLLGLRESPRSEFEHELYKSLTRRRGFSRRAVVVRSGAGLVDGGRGRSLAVDAAQIRAGGGDLGPQGADAAPTVGEGEIVWGSPDSRGAHRCAPLSAV